MAKKSRPHKIYKLGRIEHGLVKAERKIFKTKASMIDEHKYYKKIGVKTVILEYELNNPKEMLYDESSKELILKTEANELLYG